MVWEGVVVRWGGMGGCSGELSSVHLHSNVDPQVPKKGNIPLQKGHRRRKVSWSSISRGFPLGRSRFSSDFQVPAAFAFADL